MNRQGPNGIGYCTYTWNPITGCEFGCDYCYASEIVEERLCKNPKLAHHYPDGFAPTFHAERLDQPFKHKKSERIFVVDMGDLFGDWVPATWITDISNAIAKAPWHTYLFLTKNPKRYLDCTFAKNHWVGTTIEHEKHYQKRSSPFWGNHLADNIKWVSMEPLMSDMPVDSAFDWIVVGERSDIKYTDESWNEVVAWAGNIIDQAKDMHVPIFIKNKLGKYYPQRQLPMENVI